MPAHNNTFPWPSYYGHFNFFEQRMRTHSRVRDLETLGDGRYRLTRANGTAIEVFICECYAFGTAEYLEVTTKLGRLDAIIISSSWCGYSPHLKVQCRDERVGLFNIGDFMAALNRPDFWAYLSESEKQCLKEGGLL